MMAGSNVGQQKGITLSQIHYVTAAMNTIIRQISSSVEGQC